MRLSDLLAVDGDDDVAALRDVLLSLEVDLVLADLQPGVVGGAPVLDLDDERAVVTRQPELLGELGYRPCEVTPRYP